MFYSSTIMVSSGLPPNIITALVGFVNFVSVFPSVFLIKRLGRKTILWTHSFLIAAMVIGVGASLILNAEWN